LTPTNNIMIILLAVTAQEEFDHFVHQQQHARFYQAPACDSRQ
jgi:hypothetical protein